MLDLIAASIIFFKHQFGDLDESSPKNYYTSGLEFDDNLGPRSYYPDTKLPVLAIPFYFKTNKSNDSTKPGFFQLEPIFKSGKPIFVNYKVTGKTVATSTVVSYKQLSYAKSKSSADLSLINNGKYATITMKIATYEIETIVEKIEP